MVSRSEGPNARRSGNSCRKDSSFPPARLLVLPMLQLYPKKPIGGATFGRSAAKGAGARPSVLAAPGCVALQFHEGEFHWLVARVLR